MQFLLGKGERLTEAVVPSGRKLDREPPYTFDEARQRLTPMFEGAINELARLPVAARPAGQVVGSLVLNPEYIAKSYYPEQVLKSYGLRAVGSRSTLITPGKRSKAREPVEKLTTQLFVAGGLSSFRRLLIDLESSAIAENVRHDLPAMETFAALEPAAKIKGNFAQGGSVPLEVVLHAREFRDDAYIILAFQDYLHGFELEADLDHRFHAGGLCFLRMIAPVGAVLEIAKFSFLRAVREMPKLRKLVPLRGLGSPDNATMPSAAAVDGNMRVAIFDGGMPADTPLAPWVTLYDPPGIGAAVPDAMAHGYAVTGAVLFGNLKPGRPRVLLQMSITSGSGTRILATIP